MIQTTAYIFPGQGSQIVGMGQALAETFPIARETFAEADNILGFPLSTLCFQGPAELLTETSNAQPAILTTSIAAWRALHVVRPDLPPPCCVAGHSLGEYSALVVCRRAGIWRCRPADSCPRPCHVEGWRRPARKHGCHPQARG